MKQPGEQLRSARPSFRAYASGWACLLLLLFAGWLKADDLPAPVTLDVPIPANLATPAWLGHPLTPAAAFATLELPILTPAPEASLLVTVYFQEKQGGFMRIAWKGTQGGATVLSDNFYENIGMANQRSLLIAPSMLAGDGSLIFQCGDSSLGIRRIKLEWLVNQEGLASPAVKDLMVTPSAGPTQPSQILNGQVNPTEPGAWQNDLVTVPLTDEALRIEEGVEFSIDLDQVPGSARLALKETGLPVGKRLVVWINDARAGTITPAVPDLLDDGYLTDAKGTTSYVGWRDGSFSVPASLLKAGVNTLMLSDEDDDAQQNAAASTASQEAPVAIKGFVMQLVYPPTPAPAAAPAPTATPAITTINTDAIQPHLSLDPTGPDLEPLPDSTPTITPTPTTP